jgi:sugar (pentulose or hexulose) kinase
MRIPGRTIILNPSPLFLGIELSIWGLKAYITSEDDAIAYEFTIFNHWYVEVSGNGEASIQVWEWEWAIGNLLRQMKVQGVSLDRIVAISGAGTVCFNRT